MHVYLTEAGGYASKMAKFMAKAVRPGLEPLVGLPMVPLKGRLKSTISGKVRDENQWPVRWSERVPFHPNRQSRSGIFPPRLHLPRSSPRFRLLRSSWWGLYRIGIYKRHQDEIRWDRR